MEKLAKVEVLRKIVVESFNDIKTGDLFYHSNMEGVLHQAKSDGIDLPETKEKGHVDAVAVIVTPKEGFELLQMESAKNLKNSRIADQNVKNITAEFTKVMNCIINIPMEAFDDEAKEWVSKYKLAHEEMLSEREVKTEVKALLFKDVDLTKQTISLGDETHGPAVSMMKGHVDALTYVKAFRAEGWDSNGKEPTEEEWKELAECEEGMLEHVYGVIDLKKNVCTFNVAKEDEGAEPITIRHW